MDLSQKLVLVFFLAVLTFPVNAATYLDIGVGYVTGDFDTGVDSTVTALNAGYGYFGSSYFYNASVSYLDLDTDGLDGQSGLGDTVLEAGYIYRSKDNDFKLFPSISVKLPTADEDEGLGSGETDVGLFVDGQKNCGAIVCTAGAGYILVGDPAGIDYDNVLQLNAGVYKPFQRAGLSAYVQYDSALIDGRSDPVKLGADWFYLMSLETAFYINGIFGLNDAAPDYGLTTGIIKWF